MPVDYARQKHPYIKPLTDELYRRIHMATSDFASWFSGSHESIEAVQHYYHYELFNPAAIFELPEGGFVLGYIREQNYPPHETARNIKRLIGYKMVSCCDPLLGIWQPYQEASDG